jgi:hypothetical protein
VIAAVELSIQRQLTIVFIEADPLELQLRRPVRTADGAGGYVDAMVNVGSLQRLRLIRQQDQSDEQLTADGRMIAPTYVLMGSYLADIQRWDEFELNGERYQILSVAQNRQYEVKGLVAYLG